MTSTKTYHRHGHTVDLMFITRLVLPKRTVTAFVCVVVMASRSGLLWLVN